MKSYLILFCVLVYCSKKVESNPLSEDVIVQRASKNNLAANNAHRVYENAEILRPQNVNPSYGYQQPTGQQYKQQWQNDGIYRPYNQFKGQQLEKYYPGYGYYNPNWVYQNQGVNVVSPAPAVMASSNENILITTPAEAYISSIPVQNQRQWVNNVEYIPPLRRQYQRPKYRKRVVYEKPVVRDPNLIRPEFILPVNNQPLYAAPPRYFNKNVKVIDKLPTNLHSLINSASVKNALAVNENRRGFLIVHPNGTIEKLDELDEIHKTHPNYILMNADDISPLLSNTPSPHSLPMNPTPVQATPSPLDAPNVIASSQVIAWPDDETKPAKPFEYPQWNNTNYNGHVAPQSGVPASPPSYIPGDADNHRYPTQNFYPIPSTTDSTLPVLNENANLLPNIAIIPSPEVAVPTPNFNEVIIDDEPITEPTVVNEDAPVTSLPDESGIVSSTPVVPILSTVAPTTPPGDISYPLDSITIAPRKFKYEVTSQASVVPDVADDDKADVPSKLTTPEPDQDLKNIGEDSDSATPALLVNIPITTTESPKNNNRSTPVEDVDDDGDDDGDEIITLSPIEIPENNDSQPDGAVASTSTVTPEADSADPTADEAFTVINEDIVKTPCPNALNEGSAEIDMSNLKTTTKPVVWFKTTNAEFWDKLTKGNDYDVIYFMQMHPQPVIQKDSKTTVFPNGTIFEEFTETKWQNKEDPEPKVTKTIKITHKQ